MKQVCLVTVLGFAITCLSGCGKPDHVTTINSPLNGVFYTIEIFNGHGAADSDYTRVYAHLIRNGKSDKQLVVDGTYLEISKIAWHSAHDATLCMQAGITNSFRSEVTLTIDDTSETIQNHLQDNCAAVAVDTSKRN